MVRSPYVFALSVLAACGRADTAARPDLVSAAAHAVGRTRNVVVFLVDTLRADHLGCYGYERDTSPNVDALAAEGILFEECLAQSSWTKPATASVLTGEYPARHGATSVHAKLGDLETLAGFVSAHGMSTAAFVANGWINPDMGFARGFDVFELRQRRPCEELVGEALDWVAERGEEPFFLYVHVIDPHDPYDPPPAFRIFCRDYDGPVTGYEEGESLRRLRDEDLDHLIALYDGEIAYVDDQFGRFVRGLEALGRDEDTAIVFLADHGEAFRDHDSWRHNPLLFREVVRVPLILRVPGQRCAACAGTASRDRSTSRPRSWSS